MYIVKPNGNYNIYIHDIPVAINSESHATVEQEKIDNSSEAQNLIKLGLILVEKLDESKPVEVSEPKVNEVKTTAFVKKETEVKAKSEIFVREPEQEVSAEVEVKTKEVPTEEIKVEAEEVKVETPVISEEVTTEVVEETAKEETKVEETQLVAKETVQKATTRKGRK